MQHARQAFSRAKRVRVERPQHHAPPLQRLAIQLFRLIQLAEVFQQQRQLAY
jgi:hypothetical protein